MLIQNFAHPNATANRKLRAVGVNIAVQKLIRRMDMYQSEQVKYLVKSKNEKLRSFGAWAPKQASPLLNNKANDMILTMIQTVRCLCGKLW